MWDLFLEITDGIDSFVELVYTVMAIGVLFAFAIIPIRIIIEFIREVKEKHEQKRNPLPRQHPKSTLSTEAKEPINQKSYIPESLSAEEMEFLSEEDFRPLTDEEIEILFPQKPHKSDKTDEHF
ncbi:MAG: hypothetical protein IJX30_00520 [Clostridia bacterium]|nr:hypothetical protein [Clostridia bacterium]